MTPGLVSVITPSRRSGDALRRCMASVAWQTYAAVEHIIVVDEGVTIPVLYGEARVYELNDLWRTPRTSASTGAYPWFIGTQFAKGEYIMFLGDDDEFLPHHVERHVEAMTESGADYSLSQADFYVDGEYVLTVGDGTARATYLDSDCIACRRDTLRTANWNANGGGMPDFELVFRWHQAKLKGVFVDEVTVKHHDGWLATRPDVIEAARAGKDWRVPLTVA